MVIFEWSLVWSSWREAAVKSIFVRVECWICTLMKMMMAGYCCCVLFYLWPLNLQWWLISQESPPSSSLLLFRLREASPPLLSRCCWIHESVCPHWDSEPDQISSGKRLGTLFWVQLDFVGRRWSCDESQLLCRPGSVQTHKASWEQKAKVDEG